MANTTESTVGESTGVAQENPPTTLRGKLKIVGPGLILAAGGVGAGDMVTSLVAGTRYGTALIWTIILGALIKLSLVEGLGRWYMATGTTILEGWHSISRWASGYFVVYLFLVIFFYGAAVTSAAALAADAMIPGVLPIYGWAIIHGVAGFLILLIGRYGLFERLMEIFIVLMFITVVGLAVFLLPSLQQNLAAGFVPKLPEGSLVYALGVVGGVSGTYSIAAYTYWVRERSWRSSSWIPVMRVDSGVGYIVTALFMISMLIIGASFLFGTGTNISGEEGLVAVSDPLAAQFGAFAKWLFLIGFWAAVSSSILGGWNAAAYLFADYVRTVRRVPEDQAQEYLSEKSIYFRGFLLWCTFPPMLLFAFGQPVLLVIIYAALGALLLPFMAITLLWLLNRGNIAREYRNKILSNALMTLAVLLFIVLAVREVIGLF